VSHTDEYEIIVLAPIDDVVEVDEWVDMYVQACGYSEGRYYTVPLDEKEPYMYAIQLLSEEDLIVSFKELAWIVEMNPDRDPSIDMGEECLPQALRIVRIIPLH
jgi:hypothetical protein